ncbi:MAG: phage Gp37/Gp68 family protein, partial [Helicobacter sp.]|nr:phage Gp37/Gp68 family protein [Helicobacter sp.]
EISGIHYKNENRALYLSSKRKLKYFQGWDKVIFHTESLEQILDEKKYPSGSKIFLNSMSDTFHNHIDSGDIVDLFYFMSQRQDLTFQILTKRADRMLKFFKWFIPQYIFGEFADYFYEDMHKHIWFGVTAENQKYANERIPKLLELKEIINENIKCFVSIEPMLSEIDLTPYLDKLDWVIVGGEKIPNNPNKARLMNIDWVESIYKQCKDKQVAFFFKQYPPRKLKIFSLIFCSFIIFPKIRMNSFARF